MSSSSSAIEAKAAFQESSEAMLGFEEERFEANHPSMALAAMAFSQKYSPLPPHLEPNPITRRVGLPSRRLTFATTVLVWCLVGMGSVALVKASARMIAKKAMPKTISVIFDQSFSEPAGAKPLGDPKSTESKEEAPIPEAVRLDAQVLPQFESPDLDQPQPLELPQEARLLPVAAVPHPTALGSGHGGGGGMGSGGDALGHASANGRGAFLSGLGRGPSVALESLDVLHQEVPNYPAEARTQNISGEVIVDIVIDEKGKPLEVNILQAAHPLLVPEVLRVAPRWRFSPVVFGGQRVRANFRICFRFILEQV